MSSVHIFLLLLSSQILEGKLVVEEELLYEKFPENFIWGVASSAYQVEGGWNEGKINGIHMWLMGCPNPCEMQQSWE